MPADYGKPPPFSSMQQKSTIAWWLSRWLNVWLNAEGKLQYVHLQDVNLLSSLCIPCWHQGDPESFQIHLYSFVWLSSAIVLVLEQAGVATAAAAQQMRGPPQPVGLGTDRQHMFLASFLLSLPSFFLWLPPSLSQTPPHNPKPLLVFFPVFGLFMRLAAWIEQRSRLLGSQEMAQHISPLSSCAKSGRSVQQQIRYFFLCLFFYMVWCFFSHWSPDCPQVTP